MKFIIDAQLPRQIAQLLLLAGHDVIHTSEMPMGNRTPDSLLNRISVNEQRILITKDSVMNLGSSGSSRQVTFVTANCVRFLRLI